MKISKKKKARARLVNLLKVLAGFAIFWAIWGVIQMNKPLKIKDIAYDNLLSVVNKFEGYTIYLKEDGKYEPYLVLSKNYNGEGDVLLLRKYLLDEPRIYNEEDGYAAYYENSKIDTYLNTGFLKTLETQVVTSSLEITDRSSVGTVGDKTTIIPRKVFLLSHTEMALPRSSQAAKEGKRLLYRMFNPRVATTKDGKAEPYWLRTPYVQHGTTVWGIRADGSATYTPLWDITTQNLFKFGVRPAFCVTKETKIERKEGIVKGRKVFVLQEETKK